MTDLNKGVPVIGVVGGVGSGKSFLARLLRDKYDVEIVDGDAAGHQVLQEPSIKEQIRRRFGGSVFNDQGAVDRRKLGQVVFGAGPEQKQARDALESIVHPRIKSLLLEQIEEIRARAGLRVIVLDAALLLEAGWHELCDAIIFVDVPFEQRLERVIKNRGWSREDLNARESSQLPLDVKRARSHYAVDNSHGADLALSQLEQIFSRIASDMNSRCR